MTKSYFIKIDRISDINTLANLCAQSGAPCEVHKGGWCIDGASIMGLMTLDLSTGVTVIFDDVDSKLNDFLKKHAVA